MNQGKFVFSQLTDFLPKRIFDGLVTKYNIPFGPISVILRPLYSKPAYSNGLGRTLSWLRVCFSSHAKAAILIWSSSMVADWCNKGREIFGIILG